MAAIESWRYGDPAKVLERKGEGCGRCRWLQPWKGSAVCEKGRKPGKRCSEWRHEQADGES